MRGKIALLPLVFILFLAFPVTGIDWTGFMEDSGPATEGLPVNPEEGEINRSNGGRYRDGVIDNFDYFISRRYPSGCAPAAGNTGIEKYAL